MRRLIWILVGSLALVACATRPSRPGIQLPRLRLAPAALPAPLALQQHLHFSYGRQQRDLDALLEADHSHVQLAVQAMGQMGVRLSWDGRTMKQQRAPWLPPQVRASRVLDDLQFSLWPSSAVAAVLPAGWSVMDDGRQRRLCHQGRTWLLLQRESGGSMTLSNFVEGYALRIESLDLRSRR